ncbi:MAG: sugar phosphate isomerase/epimerase [Planctomycetota bacterium]|nr:sugar phosphate isomerase/epimerase [Planctomycetota bacterium]
MKLAFSIPNRDEAARRACFAQFREYGFAGLQLKGDYRPYLDEPKRFFEMYPQMRGAMSGLILGAKLDEAGRELLRRTIRFAGATQSALVILCLSEPRDGQTAETLRANARSLSELGREALDAGTKLSLHNHADQPVMTRADAEVFFEAAAPGTVGLTVDTAHFAKGGERDLAGIVRAFRGVIDNFHVKDFDGERFRMLGEGAIDFAPLFAAIRETGYDGWISADEESGAELGLALKTTARFLNESLSG